MKKYDIILIGTGQATGTILPSLLKKNLNICVIGRGDRIVPREDPDISEIALKILKDEGLEFYLNSDVKAMEQTDNGIRVQFTEDGIDKEISGSDLLLAIGRVPNTDMLNLESTGVKLTNRGFIEVNDFGQTSIPHIFALGDVNGKGAFTHTSVHDGQVFIEHLNSGDRKISDRIPIHSMFIDPPLARVGMSEKEAENSGKNVLVATMKMR